MPVSDVVPVRQAEALSPLLPHLLHGSVETGGDPGEVVVLDPGEVPDEPADRVRVGAGAVEDLRRVHPFEHAGQVITHPLEALGDDGQGGGEVRAHPASLPPLRRLGGAVSRLVAELLAPRRAQGAG